MRKIVLDAKNHYLPYAYSGSLWVNGWHFLKMQKASSENKKFT